MGSSRRRNTEDNPTGNIRDLVRTRNRRQRQKSDGDRNVHVADPSRRANLPRDVRRYGLCARLIRVMQLFQVNVPPK